MKEYVDSNSDKTLAELGERFLVSITSIWCALKKLIMFIKKTLFYKERNKEKRANYMEMIKDIPLEKLIYIDESVIDHNDIKTSCWAKRGAKIIGERSGKRRTRTSVIAALNGDEIKAPIRFTGTANTALFVYWVEHVLLPTLIAGQAVVMDNCLIHKSTKVKALIESVGCRLNICHHIFLI